MRPGVVPVGKVCGVAMLRRKVFVGARIEASSPKGNAPAEPDQVVDPGHLTIQEALDFGDKSE